MNQGTIFLKSTHTGNFYFLKKSERDANKNNERSIIIDSERNEKICLIIKPDVYTYL
ncbi:MAG: hypothetical protein LBU40_02345 [Methanobrevibacter sp.]|nr:hypothetical protein [Methanobrevibacter sp.]